MGCGIEFSAGSGRTPEFVTREKPVIVRDLRGFNRLDMARDKRDTRTVQSSLWLAQGWRANCDIQILLYESNPDFPDPCDIAKVTDYVVSYACKGNESLSEERNQIAALIKNEKETSGTTQDVKRLARKILNKTIGHKMISKQEAIVQGGGLKLFDCSERIETVSLSSSYRLCRGEGYDSKTMLMQYAKRDDMYADYSLHEYFMFVKNFCRRTMDVVTIPHYVGGNSQPCYPPSEGYAKSVMLIHSPWKGKFEMDGRDFVSEFSTFLKSHKCPDIVRIPYERIKHRYLTKKTDMEPTMHERTECYEDFTEAPEDLLECVKLAGTFATNARQSEDLVDVIDFGESFLWHIPRQNVSNTVMCQRTLNLLQE